MSPGTGVVGGGPHRLNPVPGVEISYVDRYGTVTRSRFLGSILRMRVTVTAPMVRLVDQ